MSRANWCKHYNGTVNVTCKAGVRYEDVRLGFGTPKYSLPCFKDQNELGATCAKCEFRTPEEIALEAAAHGEWWAKMAKARDAILKACGGPWKRGSHGRRGVIACPACGAPDALSFTQSGYNGHIHAACKTEGCVQWME